MNFTVHNACLNGKIDAIPSKSHVHRLLIAAALYGSDTTIILGNSGTEASADIHATIQCLKAMGARIEWENANIRVRPIDRCLLASQSQLLRLYCGESGSTLRFLLPVACALGINAEFYTEGRLPQRPLTPLREQLIAHGCKISEPGSNPLKVSGALCGGIYEIAGGVSSQYITGLLLALPLLKDKTEIKIIGTLESKPYVDMTKEVLLSIHSEAPQTFYAEGDWSNAAFWIAAGALSKSTSAVCVSGLSMSSKQGDKAIIDLLKQFGADITAVKNDKGLYDVIASPASLRGIEIDAADIPDLVPILSLVAAAASGTTVIRHAARLRLKESDRLKTVSEVLSTLGAAIRETDDGLIIEGGAPLRGGTVDSYNDHRIAMMAAIAGTISSSDTIITNAEAVYKSYPHFWDDFNKLSRK